MGAAAKRSQKILGMPFARCRGMIIRDLQTLLELPTLRKDKARLVALFEGQEAIRRMRRSEPDLSDTATLKAEFSEWLNAELATLCPRHAEAVREYFQTGRKKHLAPLCVSRAYFNELLKRLGEKWSRVSR